MRQARVAVIVAATALAVTTVAGPVSAAAPAKAKAVSGNFVGKVDGSNAYVAVYADKAKKAGAKREILAYVCDSAQVAEWFHTKTNANSFTLTSDDGATLKVKVTKKAAAGRFTPAGGAAADYSANSAKEPAGLYRSEQTIAGTDYLGGWILLPDGTQRGDVKNRIDGMIIQTPMLISGHPLDVPGIGTLMPERTV